MTQSTYLVTLTYICFSDIAEVIEMNGETSVSWTCAAIRQSISARDFLRIFIVVAFISMSIAFFHAQPAYAASGPYSGPNGSSVFVILVKTDNVSSGSTAANQYRIRHDPSLTNNYNVDCDDDGDLDLSNITSGMNATCVYASPGTYSISISGTFPKFYPGVGLDKLKLLEVQQWGSNAWTSMANSFENNSNVQITASDTPNLSNVTNMSYAFAGAGINSDISNWDVSHVTNMWATFAFADSFDQDLSNWDFSNVTNTSGMFSGASSFNQDPSSWDVSHVTNMSGMFANSALSTANYDALLAQWSQLSLQSNVSFGTSSRYCSSETERQYLITHFNWTISDAGNCMPGVATGAPSNIGDDTATANLTLSDTGGGTFYELGVELGTDTSYSLGIKYTDTLNTGSHEILLIELECETTYHYRAYAQNSYGTVFGEDESFLTGTCQPPPVAITGVVENIGRTTATAYATVYTDVVGELSGGIEYGIDTDYAAGTASLYSFSTDPASIELTGLSCETTYHYRAFAHSEFGDSSGDDATFTTLDCGHAPVVETGTVVNTSIHRATLSMAITSNNAIDISSAGIEYGPDSGDYSLGSNDVSSSEQGDYEIEFDQLNCDTTYHYRAYALSEFGDSYGDDATFTTDACPGLADLSTSIHLNNTTPIVNGDEVTYTITIKNNGPSEYFNDDYLLLFMNTPRGSDYISFAESSNNVVAGCEEYLPDIKDMGNVVSSYDGGLLSCAVMLFDFLAVGEQATFLITLTATEDFNTGVNALRTVVVGNEQDVDSSVIYSQISGDGQLFDLNINNIAVHTYGESTPSSESGASSGLSSSGNSQRSGSGLPSVEASELIASGTTDHETIDSDKLSSALAHVLNKASEARDKSNRQSSDSSYITPAILVSSLLVFLLSGTLFFMFKRNKRVSTE